MFPFPSVIIDYEESRAGQGRVSTTRKAQISKESENPPGSRVQTHKSHPIPSHPKLDTTKAQELKEDQFFRFFKSGRWFGWKFSIAIGYTRRYAKLPASGQRKLPMLGTTGQILRSA
ncbi:hypothetical protein ASPTUDRAFT_64328 [Aspergillus tubingensis CBS 134.48]|uniref:Uncharacterized protein n=1 Tax=Aspergillus tubingensis (strain CBS 134.48) TaxID=767770 RepID=A0A1L9NCI6_ASPTC|nr:hypothetical protein ASPTUDRAFT_64328 [Aspergillus tubingensis CBS 134.48]